MQVNCWEINQVTSKCQIDFLNKTSKKGSTTEKSEYYYQILHIWNSLATVFPLKLTILNFWTIFNPKRVLPT